MTSQQQLELSLAGAHRGRMNAPRERSQQRANWWFSQMRQVVEHAMDWEPAPRFTPQPIWFPPAGGRR